MPSRNKDWRRGSRWREAQALVFARPESICARCKTYVDQYRFNDRSSPEYNPWHAMARSAGHIIALDDGGAPYDQANLQLEHRGCGSKHGRSMQTEAWHSREW